MSTIITLKAWFASLSTGQMWGLVFALCAVFAAFHGSYGAILLALVFALIWWFIVADNYDEKEQA